MNDSFWQARILQVFYDDMYNPFFSFIIGHSPSFNVYSEKVKAHAIQHDTSRKNELFTLRFDRHPFFSLDTVKGRLERFTSVCADGSCVYEASSKLYFSFETETEARRILNFLIDTLQKISAETFASKTGII